MRKLVFGCGYLGERVAARWVSDGDHVSAVTRSTANAGRLRERGIEPVVADVTDATSLAELPVVDTVLYAIGFDRSSGHSMRDVYVDGLKNVLRQLVHSPPRHFLYISSTSVYGQNDESWVDEISPTMPTRENGQVCLDAEELVGEYFSIEQSATAAQILRLAGIYGPNRLLARIESLRRGDPLQSNPDGWLNLINIDDATEAVLACEKHGQPGKRYLIADDLPVRRQEFYERLASLIGAPTPTFSPQEESEPSSLGKRCRNDRMHADLHMNLSFPSYETGLPQALAATELLNGQ